MSVVQYDMLTNKIVNEFDDYSEAAKQLGLTKERVYFMCEKQRGIKRRQLPYYLRYKSDPPEPHIVYDVYDLDFNLITTYWNIQTLSNETGICYSGCLSQLKNNRDKELRDRCEPSSGLYIVEREVK